MEQCDGEGHTLPHDEHHNQENDLEGETKPTAVMTLTGVKAKCTNIFSDAAKIFLCTHYILQRPCIWTYREYCCGYCTPKQGFNIISHHFFSKYRQAVVIERIFVIHIKPPENSSSPCKTSQQKRSLGNTKASSKTQCSIWRLPIEPMMTRIVNIHTSTLEM